VTSAGWVIRQRYDKQLERKPAKAYIGALAIHEPFYRQVKK